MTAENGLPGPESHQEGPDPLAKGIVSGEPWEAGSDRLTDAEATDLLGPAWRDENGHDEWCESHWDRSCFMWHPCDCGGRAASGIYPDGRRKPE